MNKGITDRDCINLSELAYQNIKSLKRYKSLKIAFYANNNGKLTNTIPNEITEDYKKLLSTFPKYYIPTFEKYKLIDFKDENDKSGYYGAAFQNIYTNDIVIANRGTENDCWDNTKSDLLITDSGFVLGKIRQQFIDGFDFYKETKKNINLSNTKISYIYLTGHSLGGGIAALQFINFYGTDSYLKEIRTFEAPGLGIIINNFDSPGQTALTKNPFIPTEIINEINKSDIEYRYRKTIQEKFKKMKSTDIAKMKMYGTSYDYVYNDLPHIGNTINPLNKSGSYRKAFPVLPRKGFSPAVYHSIGTYKIYAFKNDNIKCGHINLENFFRYVVPLFIDLKLNRIEVICVLEGMYDNAITKPDDIKKLLVSMYRKNAAEYVRLSKEQFEQMAFLQESNRDSTYFIIYRYSVFFNFLRNGDIGKRYLISAANTLITSDYKTEIKPDAPDIFSQVDNLSEWDAENDPDFIELAIKLSLGDFSGQLKMEALHNHEILINDIDELKGYLILIKLQAANPSLSLQEREMYYNYYIYFNEYAEKHTDFFHQRVEMEDIIKKIIVKKLQFF